MQQSEIIHSNGGTMFAGPDAVNLVRAVYLASHLKLFAKTGIRPTRHVGPTDMLRMATGYTGKKYKRGAYLAAAEDVRVWVETMKAALPVTDERDAA